MPLNTVWCDPCRYGLSFSFHAHSKEPVEAMIHMVPIYVMYVTAVAGVFEMFMPNNFAPPLVRIYCLFVLGSWFFHAGFIIYLPYPFPGRSFVLYTILSIDIHIQPSEGVHIHSTHTLTVCKVADCHAITAVYVITGNELPPKSP